MSSPKINNPLPGSSINETQVNRGGVDNSTKIETNVDGAARQTLPPVADSVKSTDWWVWNWFNWEKNEVSVSEPQEEETEEEWGGEFQDSLDLSFRRSLGNNFSGREEEELKEERGGEFQELLDLNCPRTLRDNSFSGSEEEGKAELSRPDQQVAFADTATKTDQIGQSLWRNLGGNLLDKAQSFASRGGQTLLLGATEVIQRCVQSYSSNINPVALIQESEQMMRDSLQEDGSQFVKLFNLTKDLLTDIANKKIDEQPKEGFLAQNILPQRKLIVDLLEINLAKGFANLAQQVAENKTKIPNYDTQSTLVNILSLFSQKAGQHVDMQRLTAIEEKYLEAQVSLSILTKKLFPNIEAEQESEDPTKKTKKQLIQEYIKTIDLGRRHEIIQELFSGIEVESEENSKDIQEFIGILIALRQRHEELHHVFSQVADDVLMYLFPNKFAGVEIPYFLQGGFGETLYDVFVKDTIVDLLQEFYKPLTPIFERDQNRIKLEALSGSRFLGNLSGALSKDLFYLLPAGVKSYQSIAHKLFILLSGKENPNPVEVNRFAEKIVELVNLSKEKNITHKALLEAYAKIANIELNPDSRAQLMAKLDEHQAKEEIKSVLITPQEIAKFILKGFPNIDPKLQEAFANELQGLFQNDANIHQNISALAGYYVEGMLLRLFITIAEKNPAEEGKDTLVVLTEKLLDGLAKKYLELKDEAPQQVAKGICESVLKDVLGIDSPEIFKELPDSIHAKVFEVLETQLTGIIIRIQQGLVKLEDSNDELQRARAEFGGLTNDLVNLLMTAIPDILTQIGGEEMRGVNMISKSVESYLGELIQGNLEVAKLLANHMKGPEFQGLLGNNLQKLADPHQFVEDKQKVAHLLGNLILVPLNRVLNQAIHFEEQKGAEFNQKLVANILVVAADHLKHLNAAKERARLQGRMQILHEDFVTAAGGDLHPGVPKTSVNYQHSIDVIHKRLYPMLEAKQEIWLQEEDNLRKAIVQMVEEESRGMKTSSLDDIITEVEKIHQKIISDPLAQLTPDQKSALEALDERGFSLKDIICQEAESSDLQRQTAAYGPAIKTVMKMLFPNGKKDLTFVPEELRGQVWKIFKKNLFPVVLPMITEVLLDPDVINQMVLSGLETIRDSLKEEIVLDSKESAKPSLVALDQASGALIVEALKTVKLPEWIKKQILDKNGQVSPAMAQALGSILRKQLNETSIKDKVELVLKKIVQKDESGNYMLKMQPFPKTEEEKVAKGIETEKKREKMQGDLKRVSREVVDVSISYFIRNQWARAQARFDKLVETIFGKIGAKLKRFLDAVFGFIFFKIIGTMLSFLYSPVKEWVKEKIYAILSLDENREMLLALLTQAPSDQPLTGGHVVYNEDLIFKIEQALNEIVEETLNEIVEETLDEADVFHSQGEEEVIEEEEV